MGNGRGYTTSGSGERVLGRAGRFLLALGALAALLVLVYAADSIVLRSRIIRGTAFGVIEVNQFLATPLKGNKVEYDLMGTSPVICSRSIFPHQDHPACWWLERHKSQWQ